MPISTRRRSARLLVLRGESSSDSNEPGDEESSVKRRRRGRPSKKEHPEAEAFEPIVEEDAPSKKKRTTRTRSSSAKQTTTAKTTTTTKVAAMTTTTTKLVREVSMQDGDLAPTTTPSKKRATRTSKKNAKVVAEEESTTALPAVACLPRHFEMQATQQLMEQHDNCDESQCLVMGIDEAGRGPLAGPVVIAGVVCPFDIPGVVDSKKVTKEEDREALFEEIMNVYETNKNGATNTPMEWAVCVMDAQKIDEINILQATLEGMKAVAQAIVGVPPTAKAFDNVNDEEVMTPLRIVKAPSIQEEGCYVVCSDNVLNKHSHSKGKATKKGKKPANNKPSYHYYALVDGNRLPKSGMPCPAEPIVKGDSKEFSIAAASILAKVTRDRLMHDYHKLYPEYNLQQHKGYPTAKHMGYVMKHGASKIHRRTFAPLKHMDLDEDGRIIE